LGKKIKHLRLQSDLTQEQLAELAGLSVTYISQIERNHNKASPYHYSKNSCCLQIKINDIFLEEVEKKVTSHKTSNKLQLLMKNCPQQTSRTIEKIVMTILKELRSK